MPPIRVSPREWAIAHQQLDDADNLKKVKRSKKGRPVPYENKETGRTTTLNHSFMKIGGHIYAFAGQGQYVAKHVEGEPDYYGYQACRKVKQAKRQDEPGETYAIKIQNYKSSVRDVDNIPDKQEVTISLDLGFFIATAKRSYGRSFDDTYKTYAVMKYAGEATLEQYSSSASYLSRYFSMHPVRPDEAQDMGLQCIEQVEGLHNGTAAESGTQYMHRDLKPANFAVKKSTKRVTLIDFGCAKSITDEEASWEKTGNDGTVYIVPPDYGTYSYAPPEAQHAVLRGLMGVDFMMTGRSDADSFYNAIVNLDTIWPARQDAVNVIPIFAPDAVYRTDIYALGRCLEEMNLPLRLQNIVHLMCSAQPRFRPSLGLVKMAFLVEKHRRDNRALEAALQRAQSVPIADAQRAKAFYALLSQSSGTYYLSLLDKLGVPIKNYNENETFYFRAHAERAMCFQKSIPLRYLASQQNYNRLQQDDDLCKAINYIFDHYEGFCTYENLNLLYLTMI